MTLSVFFFFSNVYVIAADSDTASCSDDRTLAWLGLEVVFLFVEVIWGFWLIFGVKMEFVNHVLIGLDCIWWPGVDGRNIRKSPIPNPLFGSLMRVMG